MAWHGLETNSMREARGFAVVKLFVTSTHMPTLYNGYLNRIGVVVKGAKAQNHENKIKKKGRGSQLGEVWAECKLSKQ